MSSHGFEIIGIGHHLPGNPISNAELIERTGIESTPDWIFDRTGIEQRFFVDPNIKNPNAHIASEAAKMALKNAGLEDSARSEIDAVILATCTPDNAFPAVSTTVASELELSGKAMPFDVNAACSGFSAAIELASGLYSSGRYERILVIGSEVFSRILNPEDRNTVILFGDGAGAWLTQRTDKPHGLIGKASNFCYDIDSLNYPIPYQAGTKSEIEMNGREVYKLVAKNLKNLLEETLADANLAEEDVDLVIPHQANVRLIEAGEKGLNIPEEKILRNGVAESGNTSAATIPIASSLAERDGIKIEGNVVVAGFGAGMILHGAALNLPKKS